MVQRKQYAHESKLSFCAKSGVILAGYGSIIQNKGKQILLQMSEQVTHQKYSMKQGGRRYIKFINDNLPLYQPVTILEGL